MLNLPRWQTIVIIAITVLSGLFALPNLLPNSVLDKLPHWYSQNRIGLGLDLRGGAHFLLEADLRSVLARWALLLNRFHGGTWRLNPSRGWCLGSPTLPVLNRHRRWRFDWRRCSRAAYWPG